MATVTPTVARSSDNRVIKFTYAAMANGDVGVPIHDAHAAYSDRVFSVFGTFGVGGSATVKATPDGGTNFHTLTDPQGNDIAITAAKSEQIMEGLPEMRPEVTAGDAATNVTCVITCRKPEK